MTDFDAQLAGLRQEAVSMRKAAERATEREQNRLVALQAQRAVGLAVWQAEVEWFIGHARAAGRPKVPMWVRHGRRKVVGKGWVHTTEQSGLIGWPIETGRSYDVEYGDRGPMYTLVTVDAAPYAVELYSRGRWVYSPPIDDWISEFGFNQHIRHDTPLRPDSKAHTGRLVAEVATW